MKEPGGFYRKFLLFTIAAVCLLILVGGIVRSTGSGMGCPDWPKCFGSWIPPTEAAELPVNYKDIYSQKRYQKNIRLANYLEFLGFKELANKLKNDQSILAEESFNPTRTWIEYFNRLLGVFVGFLFILNVTLSIVHRQLNSKFTQLAILNLVLVGFQGWVGSVVVSTNLLGGLITFHVILALLILAVLIYNYWLTEAGEQIEIADDILVKRAYFLITLALILFTIQVILGTQVREFIDLIAARMGESRRADWVQQLGLTFYIHRSYSIVVLAIHVYFAYVAIKMLSGTPLISFVYVLVGFLVVEIITGSIMAYFAIPPVFQPIHLLLATLIFGIDFYLLLYVNKFRKPNYIQGELNRVQE